MGKVEKSTEELVAEREALKRRIEAIRALNDVKKQRDDLEKEVRDLHRQTSTKWRILRGLKNKGGPLVKEAGKFFAEETRNFINEVERENSDCTTKDKACCAKGCECKDCGECGKVVKEAPDTGEGLL